MSSVCSNMSVSCLGEDDVDIDVAIDKVFNLIQSKVNDAQCCLRQMAMSEQQDIPYIEVAQLHYNIEDFCDGIVTLFKELKNVSKQVLGKPQTNEEKDEFKAFLEKRKIEIQQRKEQDKLDKATDKLDKMSIIKE